jgi:hypothetical protein
MIALLCFVLAVLASPFKSKSRLEAENTALRHQLIVLRRQVRGQWTRNAKSLPSISNPFPTEWSQIKSSQSAA